MKYSTLILLCCVGCSDTTKLAEWQLSLRSTSTEILSKQSETIDTLEENTAALRVIEAKLEAALTVPTVPIGKESDSASALDPQKTPQANGSQPSKPVASSSGGRLTSDGTRLRWDIAGNWNPTILETAAHLRQDHGVNTDGMSHQQMADLHAALQEGRTTSYPTLVSRGASCPNGICPTNSRPRRGLFGWRR